MAEPSATVADPHAVELDRMLDELWTATHRAQGMLRSIDSIFGRLRESACDVILKGTTDGLALDFLIEEGKCAAEKAHDLAGDLDTALQALGESITRPWARSGRRCSGSWGRRSELGWRGGRREGRAPATRIWTFGGLPYSAGQQGAVSGGVGP